MPHRILHHTMLCSDRYRSVLSWYLRTAVRKRIRRIFDTEPSLTGPYASPRQAAGATHRMQPHGAKVSEPFEICTPPTRRTDRDSISYNAGNCKPEGQPHSELPPL